MVVGRVHHHLLLQSATIFFLICAITVWVHFQTNAESITAGVEVVGEDLDPIVGQLFLQILRRCGTDIVSQGRHLMLLSGLRMRLGRLQTVIV